jgi:DNA-binding transcriptional LysR family regulator
MDFKGLDLNLLAAFDALMLERNVTRAAARVGVSQPAMSAALGRLRTLFADPLFLRSAEGLLPTARAREMAEPVAAALHTIETALLARPHFDPTQASTTFNLGMTDYPAHVLLPQLIQAVGAHAPGITLNVHGFNGRDSAVEMLDAGSIDMAIGILPTQTESRILSRPLLRDEFVTLLRHDHPSAGCGMDLETFLSLPHVLVSPEGDRYGVVDQALAQIGRQRRITLTLAHMFAAPALVAHSDHVATLMKRVVLNCAEGPGLKLFTPPVALPVIEFHLLWHRRNVGHQAQQWLRERVIEVAHRLK